MVRSGWVIVGGALGVALALGGFAFFLLPGLFQAKQVVSAATSPDGSWSVAVVGRPTLSGSYELVVEVKDSQGEVLPTGSFVVGLTSDIPAARRDTALSIHFVDNTTAKVGSHTLDKPKFIRKGVTIP